MTIGRTSPLSLKRTKIFISYSHPDRSWLDRLTMHTSVLERQGLIHLWSDTRIAMGSDWLSEIEAALSEAQIAVLLVSPPFLASKFIWDQEMPRIQAHRADGMEVLPLIVRPCAWMLEEDLKMLQARPQDGRALSLGSEAQIDSDLAAFVYELAGRLGRAPADLAAKEWEAAANIATFPGPLSCGGLNRSGRRVPRNEALTGSACGTPVLSPRWSGTYKNATRFRLSVTEQRGTEFSGTIDYLTGGTSTLVKGSLEVDPALWARDPRWESVAFGTDDGVLRVRFREIGYKVRREKEVDMKGEYLALLRRAEMQGAWFKDNIAIGTFTLQAEKTD
jgi:hypothetical protein